MAAFFLGQYAAEETHPARAFSGLRSRIVWSVPAVAGIHVAAWKVHAGSVRERSCDAPTQRPAAGESSAASRRCSLAPATAGSGALRSQRPRAPTATAGNHNHTSSLASTSRPHLEKNARIPSGATSIGCTGQNMRSSDSGHIRAMPRPPLVAMSTRPCDNHAAKRNAATRADGTPVRRASHGVTAADASNANPMECVHPR